MFGTGEHGQLGLGAKVTEAPVPAIIRRLSEPKLIEISAGYRHAMAITTTGWFAAGGTSQPGCCRSANSVLVPALTWWGLRTGDIFTWGCGLLGRLGHGNKRNYFAPRRVATVHQLAAERCVQPKRTTRVHWCSYCNAM